MAQCARLGLDFQERGGPRSVSGEPIEETTITAFNGAETLPPVCLSGDEISNAGRVANSNGMKLRIPHLPGRDFTVSPQAGFLVVAVCICFWVQARLALVREQAGAGWLPHPATQADADVTTTRISSAEVMEARCTKSILRRDGGRKVSGLM